MTLAPATRARARGCAVVLSAVLLAGVCEAATESAAEDDGAPEVEIEGATRHPVPVLLAPQNVSVITRRDIQELNPKDVSDLLALLPGVDVFNKEGGEFEASTLGSNRDYNNRMVVQIDGRPMMNPLFGHTSWRQLPIVLDSIERIEVIKGPSSAQYGANAFAGVINIVTDSGDPLSREGKRSVTTVGDGGYLSQTLRASEWKVDRGFTLNLRYWGENGPRPLTDANGIPSSGFENVTDQFAKFIGVFDYERNFGTRTRLSARVSRVKNNGHSFDAFSDKDEPGTAHVRDTSLFVTADLFHQLSARRAVLFKFQTNVYRTDHEATPFGDLLEEARKTQADRFSELELQGRSDLGRSKYVYGLTYRTSVNDGFLIEGSNRRVDTETAYGQLEYELDKKNEAFAGLLFYNSSQNGFDSSPKLSLLHKISPEEVVRVGWGRSFRAPEGVAYFLNPFTGVEGLTVIPGLKQAAQGFLAGSPLLGPVLAALDGSAGNRATFVDATGAPGASLRGNLDLKNESLEQFDVGWERRNRKYSLKLDAWHSKSSDLILVVPTTQALFIRPQFTPSGNAAVDAIIAGAFGTVPGAFASSFQSTGLTQTSNGVSLAAGRTLSSRLRIDGNATYQDVELKGFYVNPATGAPVTQPPFSPHRTANLIVRYQPRRRDTLTAVAHYTSQRLSSTILVPAIAVLPGFTTVDLALLHTFDPQTRLSVAVKNVLDDVHPEFLGQLDIEEASAGFGGFRIGRSWLATLSRQF